MVLRTDLASAELHSTWPESVVTMIGIALLIAASGNGQKSTRYR